MYEKLFDMEMPAEISEFLDAMRVVEEKTGTEFAQALGQWIATAVGRGVHEEEIIRLVRAGRALKQVGPDALEEFLVEAVRRALGQIHRSAVPKAQGEA